MKKDGMPDVSDGLDLVKCALLLRNKDLDEKTKDDIKFAIKTEKAYQKIKKRKCKTLPLEEFLKEIKVKNG